jgi:hypothetical protein
MMLDYLGDCRNEELINRLFGSVSEFARLVEEKGNDFHHKDLIVKYDKRKDIHFFFLTDSVKPIA